MRKKSKASATELDASIGKKLKMRRLVLGLSQEELAKASDLSFQQIQKYEKGLNRISAGRLYHFSEVLQVPISFFFEDIVKEEDEAKPTEKTGGSMTISNEIVDKKETLTLVNAYCSIKDQYTRNSIRGLIKSMAKNIKP